MENENISLEIFVNTRFLDDDSVDCLDGVLGAELKTDLHKPT